MKIKLMLGTAVAIAALQPQIGSAQSFVLDTGAPSSGTDAVLNSSNWYAAEFTLGAGQTITNLSAYLTQGSGEPGNTYTWDLYSASGTFLGRNREGNTDTTTGTFSTNGWNSTTVNWNPGAGTYWIALQVSSSSQTPGLDLPTETLTTTGTAPALAFAYSNGTSTGYALETNNPIGVEVTAVPLPAAVWLLGSGLASLGFAGRRRRG
jgi:hypothetical protein